MKKQLLLVVALVAAVCAQAQVWQKGVRETAPVLQTPQVQTHRATITPTEGQVWWGYMTEADLAETSLIGLGASNTTFMTAIYVPANHEQLGTATIKAVRVYVGSKLGSTMSNASVWISKTMPATLAAADYSQSVKSLEDGANDILLSTPYAVNNEGFYIGYCVTSTNGYPIMCCGTDAPNAFLISAPGNMDWSDLNGEGFGKLAFQILVDGGNFVENAAELMSVSDAVIVAGQNASNTAVVKNVGKSPLSSLDYTITAGGVTGSEQHAELATAVAMGGVADFAFNVPAAATVGQQVQTLTITKVNGVAVASGSSMTFNAYTVSHLVPHRVTVEEFTGTGCGYCPRGLVGMDNLRNLFGNDFVGIGIHQYNSSDPMYISTSSYKRLNFAGAPQCTIERRYYTDPYYGEKNSIAEDFLAVQAIPALVGVEVDGAFTEDGTQVNATATVESLIDDMSYNIEYVLIADGLTGTDNSWKQSNYYYQYSASQLPDDLAQFGSGGKLGTSLFSWTFNDVALSSSYVNNTNQAAALNNLSSAAPVVSNFTLSMPTKTALLNAIDRNQVYVIALVVDPASGFIVNAAKSQVKAFDPTGVETVMRAATTAATYYTLDGKQHAAPQRGLNIVKMADGTIRKVMVK